MFLRLTPLLAILALSLGAGCSVRKLAVNSLADALAESSGVYASDSDLELIRAATPFALKTMETLLTKAPDNRGLLVGTASGFTQYAFAFVQVDSEMSYQTDPEKSREERLRAKKLYLRARDYGFRALEVKHPGFRERVRANAAQAAGEVKQDEVAALYWTAVAWAAAIASDKEDMDLVADLHLIEPMIRRCLELDEAFDQGSIHEFMISFEGGRSDSQGGSVDRARKHFARASELSGRKRMTALVSLAENVSVQQENRKEFETLLQEVLAFDVDSAPDFRLVNLVAQKRARLLLSRIDDLFI